MNALILIAVAGVTALVIYVWRINAVASQREHRVIQQRTDWTLESFLQSFPEDQREVASLTYAKFQPLTRSKQFPFRKDDDVCALLKVDPEDVEDAVKELLATVGCQPKQPGSGTLKLLQTVGDVVEFVAKATNSVVACSSLLRPSW